MSSSSSSSHNCPVTPSTNGSTYSIEKTLSSSSTLESSEPWDLPTFNINETVVPKDTRNPIEIEDERTDGEDEQIGIFDMKMALMNIVSSESAKGTVVINGLEQHFTYDAAPSPDGRGSKTFMFHSLFSLRVPLLYWYRCYAGMCTRFNAVAGHCMTECGNLFVCMFETRCPAPRYDPVFFFAETKLCHISKDWNWARKYKLAPNAPLTVDLKEVNK